MNTEAESDLTGTTYWERTEDGHYVEVVFCELCHKYLGVNYPSWICRECHNAEK